MLRSRSGPVGEYAAPVVERASMWCANTWGCGRGMAGSLTPLGGVLRWLRPRASHRLYEPVAPAAESALTRTGLVAGAAAAGVAGAASARAPGSKAPHAGKTSG